MNVLPWRLNRPRTHLSVDRLPRKPRPDITSIFVSRANGKPSWADLLARFPNLQELTSLYVSGEAMSELFDAAAQLEQFDKLALPHSHLPNDDKILQLQNLRWLELEYCQISHLPLPICELTRLEALDLGGNPLARLPREIGQLRELRCLTIGQSHDACLAEIPDTFGELQALHYLRLYPLAMPVAALGLERFPNLRYLGIHSQSIPECVAPLTGLHGLAVDCTKHGRLPDFIGEMRDLEYLRVTHTPLAEVPAWISRLKRLRALHLYSDIAMDLAALVDAVSGLEDLLELFLWETPKPAVKRKLAALGFSARSGNWHLYRRPNAPEELIEPFPRE